MFQGGGIGKFRLVQQQAVVPTEQQRFFMFQPELRAVTPAAIFLPPGNIGAPAQAADAEVLPIQTAITAQPVSRLAAPAQGEHQGIELIVDRRGKIAIVVSQAQGQDLPFADKPVSAGAQLKDINIDAISTEAQPLALVLEKHSPTAVPLLLKIFAFQLQDD